MIQKFFSHNLGGIAIDWTAEIWSKLYHREVKVRSKARDLKEIFQVNWYRYGTQAVNAREIQSPFMATAQNKDRDQSGQEVQDCGGVCRQKELVCSSGLRSQGVLQKNTEGWKNLVGPQARQEPSSSGKTDRQGPELVMSQMLTPMLGVMLLTASMHHLPLNKLICLQGPGK